MGCGEQRTVQRGQCMLLLLLRWQHSAVSLQQKIFCPNPERTPSGDGIHCLTAPRVFPSQLHQREMQNCQIHLLHTILIRSKQWFQGKVGKENGDKFYSRFLHVLFIWKHYNHQRVQTLKCLSYQTIRAHAAFPRNLSLFGCVFTVTYCF